MRFFNLFARRFKKKEKEKKMANDKTKELLQKGRDFMKLLIDEAEEPSDQERKLPQPPLCKARMSEEVFDLPLDFTSLKSEQEFLQILNQRESRRIFSDEPITLLQLSYLLWTTQGVKSIRGMNYATFRTVPCGGARHEFETYLLIRKVEGLKEGAYHYLPLTHQIEFLKAVPAIESAIKENLNGQGWASSASVLFFWSVVPYRSEWRYSVYAHRVMLIDCGYISQNLYLACESLGLGTCAIASFDLSLCDQQFGLDGNEEFILLVSPVGTLSAQEKAKIRDPYAYIKK
jgi:SagB-type dehydrogenase family enzyme